MVTRRTFLGLLASTVLPSPLAAADVDNEPQYLADWLRAGQLPHLAKRLPKFPRVVNVAAMGRVPGHYGGSVRMIIGSQNDLRFMTIYGYARLVGYDRNLTLQPDILESFSSVDDMVFTFKLREGHKWSDGQPFTANDFRYWWEDVILNKELTPGGGALELRPHGSLPRFEVLDELTVRYSWDDPNPGFLSILAAPQPLIIAGPAHYLKQFHKKYQDSIRLASLMKENRAKKWQDLHIKMGRSYRPENPNLPVLDPWKNTTAPPAEQFIFERNPYFHRVDENGRQLPYIDRMILNISSSSIIAAKTGAGESDLQATGIDFSDYTFLKEAEKRYPVKVNLWKSVRGSRVALFPNLNSADPVWRDVLRDVRVRRAMSLAIDRREINMAVFYGLGTESANTVLPDSPLFKPEYASAWIAHDPDQANALLDDAGLARRDDDGIRLLPDGRRMEITVETPGESTLDSDVLELVTDHWRKVGIALFTRVSQRDVFQSRAMGGRIQMSLWFGLDNGAPTADMTPAELAPTTNDQMQWPLWGMYYLSRETKGVAPDVPEAAKLVKLLHEWEEAASSFERAEIWHNMLAIYSDQVFSIGLVNGTLQPIVHSSRMQNVPDKALYGFTPTCYLGVYMPDTFWMKEDRPNA
ncbi:ABC transporter substrate-binding protein [Rhizobium lusitanum]|uniref:Peptide/nickel transport system substrate-binding protein n=1 Tax=Rhizobium lusitanum TaxID=293958 RepID=A0A7X0MD19_9HYPH|nr:ABC transporter substrate-binding protein [Rhizobium lusitanum]MBB6484510.1 peptide/nickel transport system substrate-binding protein [Rhizobium lusitanum]